MRWEVVQRLLPQDVHTVLEIGAGLGAMGAMLAQRFDYAGIEPDLVSQRIAAERTAGRVLLSTVDDLEGTFDLVCAFEVIEHIEDDQAALALWRERSSKWLLLSTPYGPERFGAWDELGGHFRRYTVEGLVDTLASAGWRPAAVRRYGFPAGDLLDVARQRVAPLRNAGDSISERTDASARAFQPRRAVGYATWVASWPMRMVQLPFPGRGNGIVALAERRSA
jgi:Methyltransferase domain